VLKNAPFTPFDKLRTGFDGLRVNGGRLENIENLPFVLSLSKHEHNFLRSQFAISEIGSRQVSVGT